MSARGVITATFLGAALWAAAQPAHAQTKMLRFPDIDGDRVVFSYAGDLWLAPATGGTASRLTAHPGVELMARFSPDGAWIAFTGQFDGDEQVYVMPSTGGVPRQLTHYPARGPLTPRNGYDNVVYGWTRDGRSILFRSLRDADGIVNEGKLYTVPLTGGLPTALPMPTAGAGDYSPDGTRMVYSPLFRDFRTWKRYQGGWAQDLYIYELTSNKVEKIAPSVRTERDPMWLKDAVYFVSDRDGTLNLYRYDVVGKAVTRVTDSTTWDVRWASSDNDHQIVFELDGELEVYDTTRGARRHLAIAVPDDGVASRPARIQVADFIEDFELSPKGERALFVARGDVFTAPVQHGPTRNLTSSSAAHDKWARWSPDGSTIAFSYKGDIWSVPAAGGTAVPLTLGVSFEYAPVWSRDGKRIAFASDRYGNFDVFVMPAAGGEARRLTFHSAAEVPSAFTADDRAVLFSARRQQAPPTSSSPPGP